MTINLELEICDDNIKDGDFSTVKVQMFPYPVDIKSEQADVIYSDKDYSFVLSCDDIDLSTVDFKIYINNEEKYYEIRELNKTGVKFRLRDINKKPFALIYGVTYIVIMINDKVLYSNPLVIAVKDFDDNEESLGKMIDEVLSCEQSFLYTRDCFKISGEKESLHKNVFMNDEVNLLKQDISEAVDSVSETVSDAADSVKIGRASCRERV